MTILRTEEFDDILTSVSDLEEAIQAHVDWFKGVNKILIFRRDLPAAVDEDAHRNCLFGRWYQSVDATEITESRTFQEIGLIHHRVHLTANLLVRSVMAAEDVDEDVYEAFTAYAGHLNHLMRQLEGEAWACLTTRDALTGLYNRRAMEALLARKASGRAERNGAVALCDIDHFKRINDTYGHQAGDDVLRIVAQAIQSQLRSADAAYRYGGEEFLIHLGQVDLAMAQTICERLRAGIAGLLIPAGGGQKLSLTISFGVAPISGDMGEALAHADRALYAAKRGGRNRVVVHGGEQLSVVQD